MDEGPSLETSNFSLYFSGSCVSTNRNFVIIDTTNTGTDSSRDIVRQIEEQKLWKTYDIEGQFHFAFILRPEG
jgi:hypothetical protein